MTGSRIPDARLGYAPSLEISGRGRAPPSMGVQSTFSQASVYLSERGCEGLPIAQKIGEKQFKYFDSIGKEITYEQACLIAEGVIFYQDPKDPTKGRTRQRGPFIAEEKARTIIENSRAGSDVANLRDLDADTAIEEDLPTIKEDDGEIHQRDVDSTQTIEKTGIVSLMRLLMILVLLLATVTSLLSVAKHEVALSDSVHQPTMGYIGRTYSDKLSLRPEIASLLKADEMGEDEVSRALLDMSQVAKDDSSSRKRQEQQAAAEIDRILSSYKESDILGSGPLSQQQREFHRIALLLHPDKGLVSSGDERACVALRLAFAARRRVLAKG